MELIKNLLALKEQDQNTVELTTFKGKEIPSAAWTAGVMYKGVNVYKAVYEDRPQALMDAEHDITNGRSGVDMQECYLGYSPSKDEFIHGYDGWYRNDDSDESGNCSPYIIFKMNGSGSVHVIDKGQDFSVNESMWYKRDGGGLKEAHKKYPDLIDIRLD